MKLSDHQRKKLKECLTNEDEASKKILIQAGKLYLFEKIYDGYKHIENKSNKN